MEGSEHPVHAQVREEARLYHQLLGCLMTVLCFLMAVISLVPDPCSVCSVNSLSA